jgi:hypothetical protein
MKSTLYSQWNETAKAIHLLAQMMGKVKLRRMDAQPAWQQVVLPLSARGFTTGLMPNGEKSFCISMDLLESRVTTETIRGEIHSFSLHDGASIRDYYRDFDTMLHRVDCRTAIHTMPQETPWTTPFEEDAQALAYDPSAAKNFFEMCVFAHNAILHALSPFRAAKLLPALFWGTFDVTGVVFSGIPEPSSSTNLINAVAFDERMVEFGFWPGDTNADEPSFFVLPYPFIAESHEPIAPEKAFFSPEKKEWFFPLRDVLSCDDPNEALQQFFRDAFAATVKINRWEHLDWITHPVRTS